MTVKPPTKESIKDALTEVRAARETLEASQIEEEARQLLLEMLRDVERSLLSYELGGLAGLRKAVERTMGSAVLNRQALSAVREESAVQQAFTALARALSLIKAYELIKQLPEHVADLWLR